MRAQYTDQLISRAERDPEFRKRLSEDPNSAVQEELGVELPEGFRVRVVQEGPNEAILALPLSPAPGQLREEELAAAVGGIGDTGSWCSSACCGCPEP